MTASELTVSFFVPAASTNVQFKLIYLILLIKVPINKTKTN